MRHFLVPEAAYAPGPSEISRQAGMNRLFRGEKSLSGLYADGTFREVFVSEQDMGHPDRTDPNFVAGRDGWVLPSGKIPSGLYIAVRPEDIFLLGISQSPGPPEISR